MKLGTSDDLMREQAALIACGVRALALIGTCPADPLTMLRTATKIETLAHPNAIPFVLDRGDGMADCGYAATQWVLDLLQWLLRSHPGTIPPRQKDRILGLLCGYSAEAIRSFEERGSGRLFDALTESDAPVSSSLPDDNYDMAGKSHPY